MKMLKKRILSATTDLLIWLISLQLPVLGLYFLVSFSNISHWVMGFLYLFTFVFLIGKDINGSQSFGKAFSGLQIIKQSDHLPAPAWLTVLRNTTILFLLPVELIFMLINPTRRIGDYLCGTSLTEVKSMGIKSKIQKWSLRKINLANAGSFILGIVCVLIWAVCAQQILIRL